MRWRPLIIQLFSWKVMMGSEKSWMNSIFHIHLWIFLILMNGGFSYELLLKFCWKQFSVTNNSRTFYNATGKLPSIFIYLKPFYSIEITEEIHEFNFSNLTIITPTDQPEIVRILH